MKCLDSGAVDGWPVPAPLEATVVVKSAKEHVVLRIGCRIGHGRLIN